MWDLPVRTSCVSAIALFERLLGEQPASEPRLLNFYGVGGIGKSRLQHELRNRTAANNDTLSVLDARVLLLEQAESVRRVDAVMAAIDRLTGGVDRVRTQLRAASDAASCMAFRGGLVPTEASLAEAETVPTRAPPTYLLVSQR